MSAHVERVHQRGAVLDRKCARACACTPERVKAAPCCAKTYCAHFFQKRSTRVVDSPRRSAQRSSSCWQSGCRFRWRQGTSRLGGTCCPSCCRCSRGACGAARVGGALRRLDPPHGNGTRCWYAPSRCNGKCSGGGRWQPKVAEAPNSQCGDLLDLLHNSVCRHHQSVPLALLGGPVDLRSGKCMCAC